MSWDGAITQLAEQQNRLLAEIFSTDAATSRGLIAYRANSHATAEKALQAAYPVIMQLMGIENFNYLARDFWHHCPPVRGDLAQWGEELPEFLSASSQLTNTPYLADVAKLEWALHQCASAANPPHDRASFSLLTSHPPEQLHFTVAAGTKIITSQYPIASIVLAHQGQADMQDAGQLLGDGVAQCVLVWRQNYTPCLRILPVAEQAFTAAICAGAPLSSALDAGHAELDFSTWLTTHVQNGWLLGIHIYPSD
jgi:hypothetical protein